MQQNSQGTQYHPTINKMTHSQADGRKPEWRTESNRTGECVFLTFCLKNSNNNNKNETANTNTTATLKVKQLLKHLSYLFVCACATAQQLLHYLFVTANAIVAGAAAAVITTVFGSMCHRHQPNCQPVSLSTKIYLVE